VKKLVIATALAATVMAAISAAVAHSTNDFEASLRGYDEVPPVSTPAHGSFRARLSDDAIQYELSYTPLEAPAVASHIHFGQRGVNGGVSAHLCGGDKPACPPAGGRVTGVITAENVIGPTGQGIEPGSFQELVAAIRGDRAYVNVHTTRFPGGEIRGHLERTGRGRGNGHDHDDD
jgi:hypothetical protein